MITCYVCSNKLDPDKTYSTVVPVKNYPSSKERICRDCCFEVASGSRMVKRNDQRGLLAFSEVIQKELDFAIEFPFGIPD